MFDTDSLTDAGSREYIEDAYDSFQVGATICWVVADGLGGHQGGGIASQLAVDAVGNSFRRAPAVTLAALQAHLQSAHAAILARQATDPNAGQMQSTLVILLSDGWKAIWGHVGDSRLYQFRGGRIVFRTLDHSVSQLKADLGELPAGEIRGDVDRNRLLQAAGQKGRFVPKVLEKPEPLYRGDTFLLCVDGFWDRVLEPEMEIDLAKSSTARDWLRAMRRRLNERLVPDADNYTAIAVRATNPSLPLPPRDVRIRRKTLTPPTDPFRETPNRLRLTILGSVALVLILALRLLPH
jgi:serine/threonine protein phosphatase PrpC